MMQMSFKATASAFCDELGMYYVCSVPTGVTPITCLDKQSKGKDKAYYKEIK